MKSQWMWPCAAALVCVTVLCAWAGGEATPEYFSAISFPAQPLDWTAAVYGDFGALLKKLGNENPLDPGSVRVVLVDQGGEETLVPTRFEPDEGAADRGKVYWNVPGLPKAAGPAQFRVCFGVRSARAWFPVRPKEVGPGSLMPNRGVERVDRSGKRPAQWVYARTVEIVKDPQIAHSGERCMLLAPRIGKDGKPARNSVRTPGMPGVIVEPGKGYVFSYWARVEGATGKLVTHSQVYWYDEQRKYIRHVNFGTTREHDFAWRKIMTALKAPDNARYAMLTAHFHSVTGKSWLDDFVIARADLPSLDVAQARTGGARAALRARDPRIRRFDFGKQTSPVWPRFTQVTQKTAYSPEQGYGWARGGGPSAHSSVLPDALAQDYVITHAEARFAVNLPDGEYRARFLIGDVGVYSRIMPTHVHWRIRVGSKTVLEYQPDAKTWYKTVMFRHYKDYWTPGVDVYERFIAARIEEKTVPVQATGGKVEIRFWRVPLCAMVIYPADQESAMADEWAHLRAARRRSVPIEFIPPPAEEPAGLSPAERERGYAVFARHWSEEVFPSSAPQEGERVPELAGFASLGEYEPFTFSVFPLRDLGAVSVSVSDLASKAGSRIPADAVEIRAVRYVEKSLGSARAKTAVYRYTIAPGPLEIRDPVPVIKGVTARWWLTLHVPADAAPGVYESTISIAPKSAPPASLRLRVRVLPIRLGPTPIIAGLYHMDYAHWYIYWWRKCFEDKDGWLRRQTFQHERDDFEILKRHGINSLAFCEDLRVQATVTEDGEMTIDPDHRFLLWMDEYARAGMGPMRWRQGTSPMACTGRSWSSSPRPGSARSGT